ncbi:RecBCD enzyme subunit RecD [Candidatus Profftia lariciata]|uniref:exodeoxyribonuclease V subunit alpha n=1 Tax=Candidatus Profftia lariciata TaxID=1987921 RepID=UPI001D01D9ED|nr:exodeoxyribonuclease V subunit alpha [Candidatus Profftia lariciata]UDG81429.1 RecBCD enzyme subunit RecD [Candidatus Profftia lariciata]
MIFDLLLRMEKKKYLRSIDIHFARLIASPKQPHLALAAALVSNYSYYGHVCLPIKNLCIEVLIIHFPDVSSDITYFFGKLTQKQWHILLIKEETVSDGSYVAPLILQYKRLYLHRLWREEVLVARFFTDFHVSLHDNTLLLKNILSYIFPFTTLSNDLNWQKVATSVALTRKVSVITGGPGTGKTTTVAKLLTALVLLYPQKKLRIQLAAPTGKAAARLISTLQAIIKSINNTKTYESIPKEAYTLHRLLGVQYNSNNMKYNCNNHLPIDVLIIDEASMIDLSMMSKIIAALPQEARLILLGDQDQLSSVEAGAILGNISSFAKFGFRPERAKELSMLCTNIVPAGKINPNIAVRDSICSLKKNYRFNVNSGIHQLAMAVNAGDIVRTKNCLNGQFIDLSWMTMTCNNDYTSLIKTCVQGYSSMLQLVHNKADVKTVLAYFMRFRLLCALREGPFGQFGLNESIEIALIKEKLININKHAKNYQNWYNGRPVMITRNDSSLGLFNGDIGITFYNTIDNMRVYFQLADDSIKYVHPGRLSKVETAYAMTVHKSQGSEFEHTLLVLPNYLSPLVTRELLYTAITRAKTQFTLFGQDKILTAAICSSQLRSSGLIKRMYLSS